MNSDSFALSAQKPARVALLDEARGLCVLLMVLYHIAYDLVYIFNVNLPWFHHRLAGMVQSMIAGGFILIAGIACRYSRSNSKRGCITLLLGLFITAATVLFMPSQAIYFGILHFLGLCMLLFGLLHRLFNLLPPSVGIPVCLLLFCLTMPVASGYLGFGTLKLLPLPQLLYSTNWLFFLGFADKNFFSADYFPLLPWFFLFLGGAYGGVYFKRGKLPKLFYRSYLPFLAKIGRHSLLIYALHQPVAYGILYLFFRALRG